MPAIHDLLLLLATKTWMPSSAKTCGACHRAALRADPLALLHGHDDGAIKCEKSILQKFACGVEPLERKSDLGKGFAGTLLAVYHGQNQRDVGARFARGVDCLDGRIAGRGDVLDDHHTLALQSFIFRQSLDRKPRTVLFRLLADEKGRDRMTLDP